MATCENKQGGKWWEDVCLIHFVIFLLHRLGCEPIMQTIFNKTSD
nr:MAG TPA: hypothetical protein [Caudoviricetes sp.]